MFSEKVIWEIPVYSYLSSYAHSDGLSNMQIKELLSNNENQMPTMAEFILPLILSTMIELLTKVFPCSKTRFDLLPSRDLVTFWTKVGKEGFKIN
jgi:hypothetical protein